MTKRENTFCSCISEFSGEVLNYLLSSPSIFLQIYGVPCFAQQSKNGEFELAVEKNRQRGNFFVRSLFWVIVSHS